MGTMVMLKNVRCSFPQLWEEEEKKGQVYSRGVTLILNPHEDAKTLEDVREAIKAELSTNAKVAKALKGKPHLLALRESDRVEFGEDAWTLRANCKRTPLVLNADRTKATPDDDPIYSGCRVNAKVEIWCQDNSFAKRVNAKLVAIQFAGDDASFDGSYVPEDKAMEGFESVDGAKDDLIDDLPF